ncbi:hypothetical protein [Streptomyces sp. ATCC 21386]|uniref:hypothetical protein n=1 Tax=Streptomyces sp. ATCC 21386 TaxID=2699428 RepID=UPI001BFF3290|nr:hypothetical protein [Streptomyces sp. ATCC 21386]
MADNQNPQGNYDPAGSTQMFRAFVDETPAGGRRAAATGPSGPRVGVIVGVIAAVAVVAAVVWLALA